MVTRTKHDINIFIKHISQAIHKKDTMAFWDKRNICIVINECTFLNIFIDAENDQTWY
jgi:hypothetical protein